MNFCDERLREKDRIAIFSGMDNVLTEAVTLLDRDTKMEDLLVLAGIFPSRSQARKNGWTGELPTGFNVIKVGKKRLFVFFLPIGQRKLHERWKRRFCRTEV